MKHQLKLDIKLKDEPDLNFMDYSMSMTRCLNWYNNETDYDLRRDWALEHWRKQEKSVVGFDKLSDIIFSQVGVLARLIHRGSPVEEKHHHYIDAKYNDFVQRVNSLSSEKKPVVDEVKVVKKTAEEKAIELARELGSRIDVELDNLFAGEKRTLTKEYFVKQNVPQLTGKMLEKLYKPQLEEVRQAILALDAELKDAYKNHSKRAMRHAHDFLDDVVSAFKQAKTVAKVRQRKAKPASIVAAKVQYLKEYPELQMKSVMPEKIVGAETVYLFNTKLRKLFKYVAIDGMTLTVKGTTLQNFDTEKSGAKTVRKPEQFFQGINDMTKRPLNKKFDEIRGVTAQVKGRISDEVIILKAF